MTARGSWKQTERKVAKKLGGKRTPLSGEASGHTKGDVYKTREYVEVKFKDGDAVYDQLQAIDERFHNRDYDREPMVLYEYTDGSYLLSWVAIWFSKFVEIRSEENMIPAAHLRNVYKNGSFEPFALEHKVGARLTHRSLVEETIERADEENKPPLVVIHKKRSSKEVALVPMRQSPQGIVTHDDAYVGGTI